MKTLKNLLLIIVVLAVFVLIIGLFLPQQSSIERSKVMNAPAEMLFDQVHNLYNWSAWSPWHQLDPNMELVYQNGGIGQGSSYSWKSEDKNVGNGKLTIAYAHAFDTIKTEMDFGPRGMAYSNYYFTPVESGTKLTWTFYSDMGKNPIGRWMGLLMKGMIKKSYDEGLANLDSVCQQLQVEDWYYVKVKTKPAVKYYGLMAEVPMDALQQTMGDFYEKLHETVIKNKVEITGVPFALYHTWQDTVKFECGLEVTDNTKVLKGIDAKELPEKTYAIIKYTGSYEGSEKAHTYMDKWLKLTGKKLNVPVMEKYKTDPMQEPDTSKWITYILYPVE